MSDQELAAAARAHADHARADITNASHRQEHIRLTRLAVEAEQLALALEARVTSVDFQAASR
jgi:hypothetical protein